VNTALADVNVELSRAARYARCVKMSKKPSGDQRDLLRGRSFDFSRKFLPNGLSFVDHLGFLPADDRRLLSQIQGRTYAYIFGLVERFISAKMLERGRAHVLDDQFALEGLVRFSNEEIKHQELFRQMEKMMGAHMPAGYRQVADPNGVARVVLAASTWSVLALTCHIELFVQSHYEKSIAPHEDLCPVFKDVFKYHWRDECQHVVLDELEWTAEHAALSEVQLDQAVHDLIGLVVAVDGILQAQSKADADYFMRNVRHTFCARTGKEKSRPHCWLLTAGNTSFGVQHAHFSRLLAGMTTPAQLTRIQAAVAPIING
jgi:hypothetical protein